MSTAQKLATAMKKADAEALKSKLIESIAALQGQNNSSDVLDLINDILNEPEIVSLETINLPNSIVDAKNQENNLKQRKVAVSMAKEGQNFVQMGVNALEEIGNLFEYALGLCVQAQSDTLSAEDRLDLEREYQGVLEAMRNVATKQNYNGVDILNNNASKFSFTVDSDYSVDTTIKVDWYPHVGSEGSTKGDLIDTDIGPFGTSNTINTTEPSDAVIATHTIAEAGIIVKDSAGTVVTTDRTMGGDWNIKFTAATFDATADTIIPHASATGFKKDDVITFPVGAKGTGIYTTETAGTAVGKSTPVSNDFSVGGAAESLVVKVDGGAAQTITISADVTDITTAVAAVTVTGATVTNDGSGKILITSNTVGVNSKVEIVTTGSGTNALLLFGVSGSETTDVVGTSPDANNTLILTLADIATFGNGTAAAVDGDGNWTVKEFLDDPNLPPFKTDLDYSSGNNIGQVIGEKSSDSVRILAVGAQGADDCFSTSAKAVTEAGYLEIMKETIESVKVKSEKTKGKLSSSILVSEKNIKEQESALRMKIKSTSDNVVNQLLEELTKQENKYNLYDAVLNL